MATAGNDKDTENNDQGQLKKRGLESKSENSEPDSKRQKMNDDESDSEIEDVRIYLSGLL